MKKYIDTFMGKIITSKFFKKMKSIFGSLSVTATENLDGQLGDASPANPFDIIGAWTANKVKKIIKKFGKKFKNEEKAENTIQKIVGGILKAVCVVATVGFFALVAYVIVKILPTVICMTAILAAFYIIIYTVLAIVDNGLGTNKFTTDKAVETVA